MTLYIIVPGHRALESQPFVRTILTAILFAGFEAGPDIRRPPVRFYLDEAATLGKLDLLMTLYTQGRKFGMRSLNFFQSVAQVADIVGGPEKIQTFRANMAGELFKAKDFQTAKEVSDFVGNMTVQTESLAWQQGANGGWSNSNGQHPSSGRSGGWNNGSTTTVSETGVLAIRPEEILQLGDEEAIYLAAGKRPIKLNILDAADLQESANSEANARYQRIYRFRVRCRAFLVLMFVPMCFAVGIALFVTGGEEWVRRQKAAQQADQDQRLAPVHQSRPARIRSRGW